MKCPRCVQRIHRAAASCPHCGFTLADADAYFGSEAVNIRCLTDNAGIFRRRDRQRVEAAMEKITRRFPQVFVAIHTGSLGEAANIRQFGFWLLNRSTFEDVPGQKPNSAGIVVIIDPQSKAAGMVFGYLLDSFLQESDTFECLSRAHAYWLEGRYADGLVRLLKHLDVILCKRSRKARRDPKQFGRQVSQPIKVEDPVDGVCGGLAPVATEGLGAEVRP